MDTNEIMVNGEVVETTEEIAKAGSGKRFKVVAGIGLALIVSVVAYKYIVKPTLAKIKNKKEQQSINEEADNFEAVIVEDFDETK